MGEASKGLTFPASQNSLICLYRLATVWNIVMVLRRKLEDLKVLRRSPDLFNILKWVKVNYSL